MQYSNSLIRLVFCMGALLVGANALADGTDAGTPVTNGVTLEFTAGSVTQTQTTNVTFVVDRKLRLDVATPNANWVSAVAGQSGATASSIQFDVTNNSNDSAEIVVALIEQGAGVDVDSFADVSGANPISATVTIWEDLNSNGLLDGPEVAFPGAALGQHALTGPTAEDATRRIAVRIDVPGSALADEYQTYTLVAAVASGGAALANDDSSNEGPGVADVPAIADDPATVQIVFADRATGAPEDQGFDFLGADASTGVADADLDGQSSNSSGFRTVGVLGVVKIAEVIFDPISLNKYDNLGALTGAEPKAIPGAVIMYVIGVSNQSALSATGVDIDDDIPAGPVGDAEPLVLGNALGATGVFIPDTVTVTIDGSAVVLDLDNTNISVDNQVHVRPCSLVATDPSTAEAFGTDPTEVDGASMGTCDASSVGYVVYFTTVDNAAS